jgi:quinol monooxygenase YgiN
MQRVGIILRIPTSRVAEFEQLFSTGLVPVWRRHHDDGGLLAATLTRVEDGNQARNDVQDYMLRADFTSMAAHEAHDSDPDFEAYLGQLRGLWAEEPLVWLGDSHLAEVGQK